MERIWLAHYPPDVPADILEEAAAYDSLVAMLEESCRLHAQRTAYLSLGGSMRYAELEAQSRAVAAWLQSEGVGQGDRVALMMPNLLQYPVCLFGILRAGAAVVTVNPLYTAHELTHQLRDADARTIVIAENFAQTLQQALPGTAIERIVVTGMGDMLGPLRGALTNFVSRRVKRLVPPWRLPQARKLDAVLRAGRRASYTRPSLSHEDLACLQYTGGTTGVAKGAMLTHGNLVSNLCQACAWVRPTLGDGPENLVITALPLYHIFALTANCLTFLRLGAQNLLIVNPRDIGAVVKSLKGVPFTALTGVNTLFNALLNHPGFARLDFSGLRVALGGGMAVQRPVAEKWREVTGVPIAQAYGLTETSPAVTINPVDLTEFSDSIGLPVPSTDVAIRDDTGNTLPVGETGELCVRGPQVMAGYWRRPDETRQTMDADGFLRTGDIGYMDERGYFYLRDRKKDMILVSGFNVYPNEVEEAAMTHPDVLEAAAIGIPDEHSGEVVKLFAVRKHPRLTEQMLIQHCRRLLTGYKTPRVVEFRDSLPRSNVGKVLRRELKG